MLRLWIGRAKSGKSAEVLRQIKAGGCQGRQILLVPEHASYQAELDLCRVCGDGVNLHAEVLSFQRLASRVLSVCGGLSDYTLDQGGKLLTMQAALQEVGPRLKVYRRPSQRVAFLNNLVNQMDEFHAYGVSPAALEEKVKALPAGEGEKLQDVALIYTVYEAYLQRDVADRRDRLTKLAELVEESGYLKDKDIYADGFSLFNVPQRQVLRTALRQGKSLTVVLLGEKNNPAEIFEQSRRSEQMLLRMAQEEGVPAEIRYFDGQGEEDELSFLERHFFGEDAAYGKGCNAITLYEAENAYAEAEWVASRILQLVRSGECRFRDITVATRHLDAYENLLQNVFERYEIPAYLSRRSDILTSPVMALPVAALETVSNDFAYEDVFHYLKTGFAGITPEECDHLENYVIRWELRGSAWRREEPWRANPDGYNADFGPRQQEQLQQINALRDRVREPLLFLREGLRQNPTAREKIRVLYDFLLKLQLPQQLEEKTLQLQQQGQLRLAREYAQIWQILCDVMDQFVEILDQRELGEEEFTRLFRLVLSQYSVGTIPVAIDQVNVTEISRNDRHTVRHLFLLGANDSSLPEVKGNGGILTEQERQLLQQQEVELAPFGMAQFHMELQNIYAALAQPTASLTVSYPVSDVSGAALRPSFVIGRIRKLFPQLAVSRDDGRQSYRLAARKPALEMLGSGADAALSDYFRQQGLGEAVDKMQQVSLLRRGKLSAQAVEQLYGKQIAMSASRIDKIRSCHFAYFMQYGLRAKEREVSEFSAPEIGTFLHYILENVARDVQAMGGFAKVESDRLHAMVERYTQAYLQAEIPDFDEKNARFRYLFQRVQRKVQNIVQDVAKELSLSDFTPLAFELGFGGREALPPVLLRQEDMSLRVSGKVDRVDGWEQDGKLYLRVVDYKTGKKAFDLADVRYGLNLQMLLYLFTLQKQGKDYFGKEIVPAGIMYLPARDELLPVSHRISGEEAAALRQQALRRSGLLLDAPEVLEAMEHGALDGASYLPLRFNRDKTITDGVASAARFEKLSRHVDRVLQEIIADMQQGNVNADPLSRNAEDSACSYCAFRPACHFEEGVHGDQRHYRQSTKAEEFWTMLEEKEAEAWEKNN